MRPTIHTQSATALALVLALLGSTACTGDTGITAPTGTSVVPEQPRTPTPSPSPGDFYILVDTTVVADTGDSGRSVCPDTLAAVELLAEPNALPFGHGRGVRGTCIVFIRPMTPNSETQLRRGAANP